MTAKDDLNAAVAAVAGYTQTLGNLVAVVRRRNILKASPLHVKRPTFGKPTLSVNVPMGGKTMRVFPMLGQATVH